MPAKGAAEDEEAADAEADEADAIEAAITTWKFATRLASTATEPKTHYPRRHCAIVHFEPAASSLILARRRQRETCRACRG